MSTQYLEPNQSRQTPVSAYERKLSGALGEIFGSGTHDLAGVVAGLNEMKLNAPDGQPWDEQRFRAEMKRLGE